MKSLFVLLLTIASMFAYTYKGNVVNDFGDVVGEYKGYYSSTSGGFSGNPAIRINYQKGVATTVAFDRVPYLGLTEDDCHMIKFRNEKTGKVTTFTSGFYLDASNSRVYITRNDIVKWVEEHFVTGAHYKVVLYDYDDSPNMIEFNCR